MRMTLAAATFVMFGAGAHADIMDEFCETLAGIAGSVMEMRQGGLPLDELMDAVGAETVTAAIARDAYSYPRYETHNRRTQAVEQFRDARLNACHQVGF